MERIKFTIDHKECEADYGQSLVDAARENGIYIPTLCHLQDEKPCGSCRVCTVKINGRFTTACTTPIECGMEIESDTDEIIDIRKSLFERFGLGVAYILYDREGYYKNHPNIKVFNHEIRGIISYNLI